MRNPFLLAPVALAALFFIAPAHANLVVNGSFEDGTESFRDGSGGILAGGGAADLLVRNVGPAWTVGGDPRNTNARATNQNGYFNPSVGPHYNADYFPTRGLEQVSAALPQNPEFNGFISQLLVTQANTDYLLSFWYAEQGDAEFPPYNNKLTVVWGGEIVSTPNPTPEDGYGPATRIDGGTPVWGPTSIPMPIGWTHVVNLPVHADGTSTLLSFIGGDYPNAILLDDIVVAVPEISSFGMIVGLGLFALGTMVRIRRRSLAAC